MDAESFLAMTTQQLVQFLMSLGISQTGCDSVSDKDVTGVMLAEFCEEDIKDVFLQFKDRFVIRKLLRGITQMGISRPLHTTFLAPTLHSAFVQEHLLHDNELSGHMESSIPRSGDQNSDGESSECETSALTHFRSSSSRTCSAVKCTETKSFPEVKKTKFDAVHETCGMNMIKRAKVKEVRCLSIDSDFDEETLESSYLPSSQQQNTNISKLNSTRRDCQNRSEDHSGLLPSQGQTISTASSELSDFHRSFSPPTSFMAACKAHMGHAGSHIDKRFMSKTETECEEQALCLKKERLIEDSFILPRSKAFHRTNESPSLSCSFSFGKTGNSSSLGQSPPSSHLSHLHSADIVNQHTPVRQSRVMSPQCVRSNSSSPASQPSSTTPDLDYFTLDPGSLATLSALAVRHTASEILSKKSQRSSPNSAQKLGSIIIRSAAQQAGLWDTTPLLRSISEPQRHCFLYAVYRVAPHLRPHQNLLWQRLSETLQNRRKYLLDKRLGKRGFSSCSSGRPSLQATDSTGQLSMSNHAALLEPDLSSTSDLSDIIREWQTSAQLQGKHDTRMVQEINESVFFVKSEPSDD